VVAVVVVLLEILAHPETDVLVEEEVEVILHVHLL
jgi:hypothetical protein